MVSIHYTLLFQTVCYPQSQSNFQLEGVIDGALSEESVWQYTLLVKTSYRHGKSSSSWFITSLSNWPLHQLYEYQDLLCHQQSRNSYLVISQIFLFFSSYFEKKDAHSNHVFFLTQIFVWDYIHCYCLFLLLFIKLL